MQQLSRPYQIALGALVVFALAWFTVLKPSDEVSTAPLPGEAGAAPAATSTPKTAAVPGAAGLGTAVAKANAAVQTSSTAAAATEAATGGEETTAAKAPAPAPAAAKAAPATGITAATAVGSEPADPSGRVLRAVQGGKVAVVLFSSDLASDDRKVRRALATADRHGGKVVTRSVPIADVAKWSAITEGVEVLQSPTLLVIGKGNVARRIVGYVDTRGIDQLVADVGGAAFAPRAFKGYKGRVSNLCSVFSGNTLLGNALNAGNSADVFASILADIREIDAAAERLDPPARYVRFHKLFLAGIADARSVVGEAAKAERTAAGAGLPILRASLARSAADQRRLDAEAARVGLPGQC